jgi:AcrR family transcriptional regulator
MNDVAEAAGVTKPVLYQHFENKRDLFRVVIESIMTDVRARTLTAAAEAETPFEQVDRSLRAFVTFMADEPHSFDILVAGLVSPDPEWRERVNHFFDELSALAVEFIQVEGLSNAQRRTLANGMIGLALSMARSWKNDPIVTVEELANNLVALCWGGMRGVTDTRGR